jgi:crotonobetainyl-CoA:carnitine CoA-transferase CaiB-like acyl-CoA transferase|eukprot:COSAG01_NODE_2668_length_7278_cov_187.051957_5_plen_65_part_00
MRGCLNMIMQVLEVPEMLANPRYATPRGRREAYDVFKPELERALSRRTVQEWCELLQARGVPCG